jgi:hypothetical protein
VGGPEGEAPRDREERGLAERGDHDRVGDDAREDRRDEGVRLEVVAVEHLRREEGRPERRAEHRRDAGRDPGDEQHAALGAARGQEAAGEGAEGGADLHGGPLAAAGAAGGERRDGGRSLHGDDPPAYDAAAVVRLDRGVAAAARRLRGETRREEPAREAAERGQEHEQPGPERRGHGSAVERLAVGAQEREPRPVLEEEPLPGLERREERGADEPSGDAHDGSVEEHAAHDAELERRLGEDAREAVAQPRPRARRGCAPRAEPGAQPPAAVLG